MIYPRRQNSWMMGFRISNWCESDVVYQESSRFIVVIFIFLVVVVIHLHIVFTEVNVVLREGHQIVYTSEATQDTLGHT